MSTTLYDANGNPVTDVGNRYSIGVDETDKKLYLYINDEKSGEGIEINPDNEGE